MLINSWYIWTSENFIWYSMYLKYPYLQNNTSTLCVPQNNSPCPTLFVANLGLNCTEQGLNQIFSRFGEINLYCSFWMCNTYHKFLLILILPASLDSCPGFLKLKMQNKRGVPVAFVDFQVLHKHLLVGNKLVLLNQTTASCCSFGGGGSFFDTGLVQINWIWY